MDGNRTHELAVAGSRRSVRVTLAMPRISCGAARRTAGGTRGIRRGRLESASDKCFSLGLALAGFCRGVAKCPSSASGETRRRDYFRLGSTLASPRTKIPISWSASNMSECEPMSSEVAPGDPGAR